MNLIRAAKVGSNPQQNTRSSGGFSFIGIEKEGIIIPDCNALRGFRIVHAYIFVKSDGDGGWIFKAKAENKGEFRDLLTVDKKMMSKLKRNKKRQFKKIKCAGSLLIREFLSKKLMDGFLDELRAKAEAQN